MTRVRDFLGPYRLARLIRVGSSCSVWEAIKDGEDERYALKVLRKDLRLDKAETGYLKHEFEVAAGLKHPNIIKIHEFTMDKETPFLVLELYSEHNMKQALRQGPDPLAFFVPKIVEQSCNALYYLHEQGWVHCDIKPDNFLVGEQGDIKLIDFTIAQKMNKGGGLAKLLGLGGKTVRGTKSYMSPEQIRGKSLDQRSDVYAFACVLFELLGGKPPYTGSTPNELLEKHLKSALPSVQVRNDNVTPEVSGLIRKAMSKRREDRPHDMWEFLKEFQQYRVFKKSPKKVDKIVIEDPRDLTL